jgi:hypothetical protein
LITIITDLAGKTVKIKDIRVSPYETIDNDGETVIVQQFVGYTVIGTHREWDAGMPLKAFQDLNPLVKVPAP